jgi:hypothetical protein
VAKTPQVLNMAKKNAAQGPGGPQDFADFTTLCDMTGGIRCGDSETRGTTMAKRAEARPELRIWGQATLVEPCAET